MSHHTARFLRSAILLLFAIGVSAWAALDAQEPPKGAQPAAAAKTAPPAPAPDAAASGAASPDPATAASPAPSNRAFKPSQEISPDREVDFPADL